MNAVDLLDMQCRAAGLTPAIREYRFHPVRRWRFDMAFLTPRLAVEVDGGVFVGGGHVRGAAYERDREKDAEAMMLGFRVLRVTPRQVKDGRALRWITALIETPAIRNVTGAEWDARLDRGARHFEDSFRKR